MYAFVYGTLKNKYSNSYILKAHSKFVTTAIVRGFQLFDSGFPVAGRRDDTMITGEIWDIGDPENDLAAKRTLERLDQLEGYHPDRMDRSMYHRIEVLAYGDDDNNYPASMYLGNPSFWSDYKGMTHCDYNETTNSFTWPR